MKIFQVGHITLQVISRIPCTHGIIMIYASQRPYSSLLCPHIHWKAFSFQELVFYLIIKRWIFTSLSIGLVKVW